MSSDFLKGILIRDDQSAYEALLQLKVNGVEIQGSGIERQLERIIGSRVSNIDTALDVLNDRINKNVGKVENKIGSISKKLTSDPERQKVIRETMENVVQGRELTTENETVKSISEAAAEIDTEGSVTDEIEAKEALAELKKAEEENPEAFRQYRMTKYVDNSLKQAKTENKNLTPEQEQFLKDQVTEIAGVMYSKGNIENQKMMVSQTFRGQSPGRVKNEFGNLRGLVGLMNSHKKPSKIIQESDKREGKLKLGGIKIPSNYEADAFDRAKSLLRKDTRSLRRLDSIQGGGSFWVRFKMTFYNFANGWRGGNSLVQTQGGYLSRIGRQPAADFVQNSMGLLLQNGFTSGLGSIVKGSLGSGVKSALGNLAGDAALKLAGGTLGPIGVAATKAIGFLKKFLGNTGAKLAPGIKNGLGNAFDKTGSGLGKVAVGLGALLGSIGFIGTATASTLISGAVVGGIVGSFAYQQYIVPAEMVSGLVTAKKDCDSRMEYVDTNNKPPIKCENMSQYNNELKEKIETAGYQTRCAVAAAAQYLTIDFPYWISYGSGQYYCPNGINEEWCGVKNGMDCNSFIAWAFRQGGYAIKKGTRDYTWRGIHTPYETERIVFNAANCARIKEIAKPGDIVHRTGHKGIVIGVEEGRLQIAQEANYPKGLMMCYINPCTGTGKGLEKKASDGEKHACNGFTQYWSMDNFFDHYVSGTSLNGLSIEPNSEIKDLPEGCDH